MGRHDADPRDRLRYVLAVVVAVVLIALVVAGVSALHALAGG